MDDQPDSQSDVPIEHKCGFSPDYPVMGFLQLCADRRFHRCLMERFQRDARLESELSYWIHADAGGTPKMVNLVTAPNYCYFTKGVKFMGWASHGDGCGGFPNADDKEIRDALEETAREKVAAYPKASHFVYFATMVKEKDEEGMVVYCRKYEKTAD